MQALDKKEPLTAYAGFMTLEDFVENVKSGMFIDYDGVGLICTATEETAQRIYPSQVNDLVVILLKKLNFTHINWFNR